MAKTTKTKKETVKKVIKKIMVNLAMALVMFAIGFVAATAAYAAGMKLNLPKITVEYENKNHDLILIDRSELLGKAVSDR